MTSYPYFYYLFNNVCRISTWLVAGAKKLLFHTKTWNIISQDTRLGRCITITFYFTYTISYIEGPRMPWRCVVTVKARRAFHFIFLAGLSESKKKFNCFDSLYKYVCKFYDSASYTTELILKNEVLING